MVLRCARTRDLEIHHINRAGDNSLSNAQVLCHDCHVNTHTFGKPGTSPPSFSEETKEAAKKRANYCCECTRDKCH